MTGDSERIGDLFAEWFGPDGGILLWQRDPKRVKDGDMDRATDTKDNDTLLISPRAALLLLRYLERHKVRFEKAIIERALERVY